MNLFQAWRTTRSLRILMLAPQSAERAALSSSLRDDGYDVVEASSVTEAEWVMGARPDVLIASAMLAGAESNSSSRLLQGLRTSHGATPIIVLSEDADLETVAEASRLGASYVFCAPFLAAQVQLAVRNLAPSNGRDVATVLQGTLPAH